MTTNSVQLYEKLMSLFLTTTQEILTMKLRIRSLIVRVLDCRYYPVRRACVLFRVMDQLHFHVRTWWRARTELVVLGITAFVCLLSAVLAAPHSDATWFLWGAATAFTSSVATATFLFFRHRCEWRREEEKLRQELDPARGAYVILDEDDVRQARRERRADLITAMMVILLLAALAGRLAWTYIHTTPDPGLDLPLSAPTRVAPAPSGRQP